VLDFLPSRGVDGVDGVRGYHAPERRQDRAAHEIVRFGDFVGVVQRELGPVLGG